MICKDFDVPHLVNNAYGVQASKCMHLLQQVFKKNEVKKTMFFEIIARSKFLFFFFFFEIYSKNEELCHCFYLNVDL